MQEVTRAQKKAAKPALVSSECVLPLRMQPAAAACLLSIRVLDTQYHTHQGMVCHGFIQSRCCCCVMRVQRVCMLLELAVMSAKHKGCCY